MLLIVKKIAFRQQKVLSNLCVALMDDYTHLNNMKYQDLQTISFEIKPKCAVDIDNKCKFCSKQPKKLQSARIQSITKYCPKNLYSGDLFHMQEAVFELLENPQNNIQIYKNSKLIYSDKNKFQDLVNHFEFWDKKHTMLTIVNVIVEILRFKYKAIDPKCAEHDNLGGFTVLEKIKQLQELDSSNSPPKTKDSDYVKSLLSQLPKDDECCALNCIKCLVSQCNPLSKHYLSKIARDCSVMLSVKQVPTKSSFEDEDVKHVCVNGQFYLFDVKVFDLFPKDEILM